MTECEWSHSCVAEASGPGPFCYLHTKIATGIVDFSYPVTRTSSKQFNEPSKEARQHLERLRSEDDDDDA